MMRVFLFFVDGIGLGDDDPEHNPFAAASLPTLRSFTEGQAWLRETPRQRSERAVFVPTDACLGVEGKPQSATGQAAIMTGLNVPETLGYHYGPKPNAQIGALIRTHSIAKRLAAGGYRIGLLNAYPPSFFESVNNGMRLLSSNQLAMQVAGVRMQGVEDLFGGEALSADLTGEGWRTQLGYDETPALTPFEAGQRMARLAMANHFTLFDHWITDVAGHRRNRAEAIRRLEMLDGALAGLLAAWDDAAGLIVLTSDHGNLEDLSERGHTTNPVPTLVIGERCDAFADGLRSLPDIGHAVLRALGAGS
jgi:2,3-bisphosphoglycerate-independent phosphoglycerate mutase